MKILDVNGKEIPACAKIEFGRLTVSISTIFQPATIAIFDGKRDVTRFVFPTGEPIASPLKIELALVSCHNMLEW